MPPTEQLTKKHLKFTTYNGDDHFGAFGNGEVFSRDGIVLCAQSEGVGNWHHSQELVHDLWCGEHQKFILVLLGYFKF